MDLKNSKTLDNLKAAFAGESQANRRYLYFAAKADVEHPLQFRIEFGLVVVVRALPIDRQPLGCFEVAFPHSHQIAPVAHARLAARGGMPLRRREC